MMKVQNYAGLMKQVLQLIRYIMRTDTQDELVTLKLKSCLEG